MMCVGIAFDVRYVDSLFLLIHKKAWDRSIIPIAECTSDTQQNFSPRNYHLRNDCVLISWLSHILSLWLSLFPNKSAHGISFGVIFSYPQTSAVLRLRLEASSLLMVKDFPPFLLLFCALQNVFVFGLSTGNLNPISRIIEYGCYPLSVGALLYIYWILSTYI